MSLALSLVSIHLGSFLKSGYLIKFNNHILKPLIQLMARAKDCSVARVEQKVAGFLNVHMDIIIITMQLNVATLAVCGTAYTKH